MFKNGLNLRSKTEELFKIAPIPLSVKSSANTIDLLLFTQLESSYATQIVDFSWLLNQVMEFTASARAVESLSNMGPLGCERFQVHSLLSLDPVNKYLGKRLPSCS